MSRMTRSGRSSSARAIAFSPSSASPTTSYPSSSSISARSSRISASSSAIRTRGAGPDVVTQERLARIRYLGGRRPGIPIGRGSGLKHRPVWVRIPPGAPNLSVPTRDARAMHPPDATTYSAWRCWPAVQSVNATSARLGVSRAADPSLARPRDRSPTRSSPRLDASCPRAGVRRPARLLPRRRLHLAGRQDDRASRLVRPELPGHHCRCRTLHRALSIPTGPFTGSRHPESSWCRTAGSTGPVSSRSTAPVASTSDPSCSRPGRTRSSRRTRGTSCAACCTPTARA